MGRQKIISFLKEAGSLMTYCLIINAILGLFYYIVRTINDFYLLDTGYNVGLIIGYLIVLLIVFFISRLIEPYKFSRHADDEFIRSYIKISAEPNYFSEICIYFISSLCTFMLGLALGPQGISIYTGILTSLLVYKFIFKTSNMNENEQILLGSSVGYSIAFLNPVAGFAFALERSKCKISLKFVVKLVFALVVTFIMQAILRGRIVSEYFITINHHMNYWLLLAVPVLVVCTCTVGLLLKKLFSIINKHVNYQNKIVKIIIYILVILIPLALKIYNPKLLGSGLLSLDWIFSDLSLSLIAIYGVIRIVFTLFSFRTSFTGGIGGSIIIMGAIVGRLLSGVLGLFIEMTLVDHAILTISTALPFYGILTKERYTSISLIFSFGNFIYLIAPLAVGYGTMVGVEQIKKLISKSIKTRKNAQKVA